MAGQLKPCGTNAAYRRHLRHGEEPCQPCKTAATEYVKGSAAFRAYQRARQRALVQLSKRYPDAYLVLLAEEKAKEELL